MTGVYNGIYSNPDIQYVYGTLLVIMIIFVIVYNFVKYEVWKVIKLILSLIYYIILNSLYRLNDFLHKFYNNKRTTINKYTTKKR